VSVANRWNRVSKLLNMSGVGGEELGRGRLQSVEWLLV
jgi:hypothetical protein